MLWSTRLVIFCSALLAADASNASLDVLDRASEASSTESDANDETSLNASETGENAEVVALSKAPSVPKNSSESASAVCIIAGRTAVDVTVTQNISPAFGKSKVA